MPRLMAVLLPCLGLGVMAVTVGIFNRLVQPKDQPKDLIPIEELWARERPWLWIPLTGFVVGLALMIAGMWF